MAHKDQPPLGHDADMENDFSATEHGQRQDASEAEAAYTHSGRQGWETQAAAPDDDFGDPEATDTSEDENQPPAKSRGGLLLPLLLFVLVLGAGGFAYWQFGMNSGQSLAQRNRDDARAETSVQERQDAALVPTPVPPAVDPTLAPVAPPSATPEVLSLPTATPPVGIAPPSEAVVAQGSLSAAPELLPPPPSRDRDTVDQKLEATVAAQPMPDVPLVAGNEATASAETPSIALEQNPPAMNVPLPPVPDHGAVAAFNQEKAALEKEVADLKQALAALNDKVQQMKAAAAGQESALKQAQAALKDATAKTAAAVKVVVPVKAAQPDKSVAHTSSPTKKVKKSADKKPALVASTRKKTAAPTAAAKANVWVLRAVTADTAWVASPTAGDELKEVHVGDVVPGLGTIKAITNKSGHWVVVGSLRNLK